MVTQFVGTWELVSQDTHYADGSIVPSRGENPIGLLIYDANGKMAVQLMRTDDDAPKFTDISKLETAMSGYHAYFGTYEVDASKNIVRHYVTGSAYFAYRETVQERHYEFSGDLLTLKALAPQIHAVRVLVWRKATG